MATTLAYTPLEEIEQIHADLRAGFATGKTKSIAFRKYLLLQLAYMLQDNSDAFVEALAKDLGRPQLETTFLEIGGSLSELVEAYKNVDAWAAPEKPPRKLNFMFMNPVSYKEPKGTVMIIAAYNYPLFLTFVPLAGAIAAGNTVVLKPSEACAAVARLMTELMPKYVDPAYIRVVNGAVAETTKMLDLPWDHILYTGSARVGKIVATAAAKHLTPVSLELGGKSPVFVDPSSDLKLAAKRILWGKIANGGQTCVAPDYVMVPKEGQDKLVEEFKNAYAEFYPEAITTPPTAPHNTTTKMVNEAAFKRVYGILANTKGNVVFGGTELSDEATKFIAPTVVRDVGFQDSLMSEEIFGPVLPIVPVENMDAALDYVNAHGHPLALYVFTQNDALKKKIFTNTQSGSATANETIIIPGITGLPFGGVGGSGYGAHTGKHGFDMFTHVRASIDVPGWIDKLLGARYPPYTDKKLNLLKTTLMPKLPARPKGPPAVATSASGGARKWFLLALAVAVAGALTKLKTAGVGLVRGA
ncbi:hypothetical protein MKEN_01034700 [Mycena kentingensis (nom. inval.)]|nr:hypothetical protein MKEN_01034700 [Mycena kentingensis (nom. inval.)]